jgi:tellurite resistance protein TehA-like permease
MILFYAMYRASVKSGGYQILLASAIISFFMFVALLINKRRHWKEIKRDRKVFFGSIGMISLIVISITIWIIEGPHTAIVWGIISESLVGFFLLLKTIYSPVVRYNLLGYIIFLIACILAMFETPDWNFYEKGYPASEIILTSLTIIHLIKKWKRGRKYRSY